MADNPITGVTSVALGGETYRLQFTWNALAQISRKYGEDANLFDPIILSDVVAIGLHKHHPEMSAEKVADASAPIVDVISSVNEALNYAYFGEKGPPTVGAENPLMARTRKARSKASSAPSSSASVPESAPKNSGT